MEPRINGDESFLRSLDQRLHYVQEGTGIANMSGAIITTSFDVYYQDQRITPREMARMLRLLNTKEGDYAITPINTNMGLSAGFSVIRISTAGTLHPAETVLSFTKRQLPAAVSWESMAETYMGKRNLELLAVIEIEKPVPDQGRYDY